MLGRDLSGAFLTRHLPAVSSARYVQPPSWLMIWP